MNRDNQTSDGMRMRMRPSHYGSFLLHCAKSAIGEKKEKKAKPKREKEKNSAREEKKKKREGILWQRHWQQQHHRVIIANINGWVVGRGIHTREGWRYAHSSGLLHLPLVQWKQTFSGAIANVAWQCLNGHAGLLHCPIKKYLQSVCA